MRYSIGLDIGISSVGWAVINLDKNRIEDLNSRMFDAAENPKNGSSLAAPRREARSARKRLRRRRYRVGRIRQFLINQGLLSQIEASQLYDWQDGDLDIWLIRVNGLERKLTDREFARILIHYAKNRGFKSNRKSETKDGEGGVLLQAVNENAALMKEKGYRTVAEMLVIDEKFNGRKRNKGGDYSHVLARSEIEKEIRTVFSKQKEFGHSFASHENEEIYINIWSSQRPFSTQEDIVKRIGSCTFEPNEKRAPKFSYTFEKFRALDKINRLRIISSDEPQRTLTDEERMQALEYITSKKEVKYKDLRKVLDLQENERFNELFYDPDETNEKNENRKFVSLDGFYQLKKIVHSVEEKEIADSFRPIDYDTLAYAVTVYKDDNDTRDYLRNEYVNTNGKRINNLANRVYNEELIEQVLNLSFSKFGHLSLKALNNIIPYLEEGQLYHEACENAGYNFNKRIGREKKKLLPVIPADEIANPVVIRSLSQTRKVLNAIIKRYGSPSEIYIEMARDMGRHYNERRDLEKQFNKNRTTNEKAKERILELHPEISNPRGHDILKFKLWSEQNGKCAYSLEPIKLDFLFKSGYAEVDHVIPYSRSFDDSNANKVLVLSKQNQDKKDRTPYEWFGQIDTVRWDKFKSYVSTLKIRKKKKDLLLKENFDNEQAETFKSRHLNDTRYVTRFLKSFIEDNLLFREEEGKKQHVYTVNGAYTSLMRKRWGFNKNREENDLHHALDAAIVAVSLPFRNRVSNYFKHSEQHASQLLKRKGERFPEPWEGFTRELEARMIQEPDKLKLALESLDLPGYNKEFINQVTPIFVSRMPKRSVKGQIHEETLRRHRGYTEKGLNLMVKKYALADIKFDKNGDFPMYGKESDPKTYQAIKDRYLEYGKDPKKAFSTPLYKPSRKLENAPIIRSVKIETTANQVVHLDGKTVAENASIARTEVFRHKASGKFYLAPVYVSDIVAKRVPDRFITAAKPYDDWNIIGEQYEFMFNLFPNDIVKVRMPRVKKSITHTKEKINWIEGFFYYKGVDSGTAALTIADHMNSFSDRIGSKSLLTFEKFQVDPLGNLKRIHREKRYGV
ncbi:type II CRISPR RNA-guided endonuclease Cas9 [Virgibacillus pantothenticus]|uniref:type II CRISPR RNA-guided endonuclease Cas9 n=1 Tax=Virgibacillus pantothenticus TaxID=1473 RepID=UPI001C21665C|nr:type II CRISPR RNA-guided endonuclease Cas9 [Virgibacillus pantothenticus]MBU8565671.1 type II CRISPR RNA-guided endonuclease Cas9 [Virgibacillus pantothenticus]MBU8601246.1 type II CRISPR RNA-guided endonuclease Cas9 [Virgibacillus pantothenticus]MBU8635596.1 type II CRISPR RNA-guided endonuclease Cas9 [Virgibacillus pantothenticus]MBU8643289.1 type II CRISPR RNA-guided endonuclease Cas9 [Virgibacillus pantothenticus]MBU8647463.1 type II CRISPR RNA-guided endonuclease Cas9 [Virgibacillus p